MQDEHSEFSVGDVLTYLRQNYMTSEELASRAGITVERLDALVQSECIPPYSHSARLYLRTETNISGRKETIDDEVRYYHPDTVRYIRDAERLSLSGHTLTETSALVKERFLHEVAQALGRPLIEIGAVAEESWKEFMAGTYGVCLKHMSADNMIKKQRAVHRLNKLLNRHEAKINSEVIDELRSALQDYNDVAAAFGPHEISESSRGKIAKRAVAILSEATSDPAISTYHGQGGA
ncbi:DUF6058 family natural product biosynthesis protein [Tepidicaulis sp. LMO-SS28]|uniref:DUF6058 family natural product biosynthesis protein n=1 Tax=Tepidicaulis sp. LMO-SS28 TaxID=3447455 RepID=UPI003EE3E4DB